MDGARPQRLDTAREIVYVLLADGALTTVKGHRTLTILMTAPGEAALRNPLGSWATAPA
jgi:hypothetical protein